MMRVQKCTALVAGSLLLLAGNAWSQCDPNDGNCTARERKAAEAKIAEQQAAQPPPPAEQQAQQPPADQGGGGVARPPRPKKGDGG